MKTIILKTILVILLLPGCTSAQKDEKPAEQKSTPVVTQTNDLPEMQLTLQDGSQILAKTLTKNVMLILFQPDCDHCQREAQQFQQKLKDFKDYQLYFISSASMPEIKKFATDYQLNGKPGVQFAWTAAQNVINNFGPIEAPSIYIYSNGKFIQSFNGEVALEVVLKYI